jgi:WD40 repeat protein
MIPRQLAAALAVAAILGQGVGPANAQMPWTDAHGDPLPAGALARIGTVRWRAENNIVLAAMLDSATALTVTEDHVVEVWDVASGTVARRFDIGGEVRKGPNGLPIGLVLPASLRGIALSRDGKTLAIVGQDRALRVWDVATGKEVAKLGDATAPGLRNLSLSNDGRLLAAASLRGGLQIWETSGEKEPRALRGRNESLPESTLSSHQFSPDGTTLLQLATERTAPLRKPILVIWDTATGEEKRRLSDLPIPANRFVSAQQVVVSPDHQVVALPLGNSIVLAGLADGKEVGHIDLTTFDPTQVFLFTPDGKAFLAASGPNEPLRVWEVPSGKVLRQFDMPPAGGRPRMVLRASRGETQAAVAPDGKTLLWTNGPALTFIDLDTGKIRNESAGPTGPLREAFFSADGATVYTRGGELFIRRWDAATGKETGRLNVPRLSGSFLLSADGRWLAAGDLTGRVVLFDAVSLKEKHAFVPEEQNIGSAIAFSPDSRYLARALFTTRSVGIYDVATGDKRAQLRLGAPAPDPNNPLAAVGRSPVRMAFARDGGLLAVASERLVTVWDVRRERQVGQIPLGEEVFRHAVFSPDAQTLALETSAGTSLWELATFQRRTWLHQYEGPVGLDRTAALRLILDDAPSPMPLAFSADGRLLARAGEDRKIRLWDTWTGKEVGIFEGHRGGLASADFAPDGRKLVTSSSDATAVVWDLGPIRERLTRPRAELDQGTVEASWEALGEQDAGRAYRAIGALAGDPARAVAFLREVVEPAAGADPKLLAQLLAELDDPKFAVRERAGARLQALGEGAAAALRQAAEKGASAELRRRAGQLLADVGIRPPTRAEVRALRAVEVLERAGTPEAIDLLKKLAAGAAEVIPTPQARAALERLTARK